jgi:hypothetical protein
MLIPMGLMGNGNLLRYHAHSHHYTHLTQRHPPTHTPFLVRSHRDLSLSHDDSIAYGMWFLAKHKTKEPNVVPEDDWKKTLQIAQQVRGRLL